jgi:peptide-methionine (R)-S-oxide reductase
MVAWGDDSIWRGGTMLTRRKLLQIMASAWAALEGKELMAAKSSKSVEQLQKNWKSLLAEGTHPPLPSEPLKLSKEEWRKRLTPAQYHVLREEGTERAGSSPLNHEKRPGIFACAGCDLPLFSSEMKYESGTGWPSFFTTIPGVFGKSTDYKLVVPRTEYHCIRCKGHQGHVFDDGPPPTGQRWCNNGIALKFIPKG